MPSAWQGAEKGDCATEWAGAKKWNSTKDPTLAVVVFGLKVRPPSPTVTICTLLADTEDGAEAAPVVVALLVG